MKTHKRKKSTRIRGSKTAFYGFRQKHKGHGNKGGFGMAATGKRANHKTQWARNIAKEAGAKSYFGKQGYTSRNTFVKKYDKINLDDIKNNFFDGKQKKIDLSSYKILGEGEGLKVEIFAKSASASAIAKMKKAGGKIILMKNGKEVKEEDSKVDEEVENGEEEFKEEEKDAEKIIKKIATVKKSSSKK